MLDWPAWITRNIYAEVSVMIGKFWIGEVENDKVGRAIMPPPVSYFSIRHSYPAKDARFLHRFTDVSTALAAAPAHDDGRDVLRRHLAGDTPGGAFTRLCAAFPAPMAV